MVEATTGIPKPYRVCCGKMGQLVAQGLLDLDTRMVTVLVKGLGTVDLVRVVLSRFDWCPFCGTKLPVEEQKVV